jgi:hypothetical protein
MGAVPGRVPSFPTCRHRPTGSTIGAPATLAPAHPQPKTSALLLDLRNAFPGDETITVRDVLDRLEGRGFGLLLLFLALPNCIPNIPGISTVFGLLLIPPALQMIFGAGRVWLPRQITRIEIQPQTLRSGIDAFLPWLEKVEHYVQPRYTWMTQKPVSIWFGIQTLILGGILILPIPLGNWPPGMSTAALAIALIQRDGVFALISFGFFLASLPLAVLGFGAGMAGLRWIIETVSGLVSGLVG